MTQNDIEWHGINVFYPDWDGDLQNLALVLKNNETSFYIAFNTQAEALSFELPPPQFSAHWRLIVDTSKPGPNDFHPEQEAIPYHGTTIELDGYSAVMLLSKT